MAKTPFKLRSGNASAFKDLGSSPVKQTKFPIPAAKRITRKYVGHTTIDSPNADESKFDKSEKKMKHADKLLKKAGYSLGEREQALGAGGYKAAMDWATSKKKSPAKQIKKGDLPKNFNITGSKADTFKKTTERLANKANAPKNLNMTGSKASTTPDYKSTKMAKKPASTGYKPHQVDKGVTFTKRKPGKFVKHRMVEKPLSAKGKAQMKAIKKVIGKAGKALKVVGKAAGRVAGPAGVAQLGYEFYKSGQKHSGGKVRKDQKSFMEDAMKKDWKKRTKSNANKGFNFDKGKKKSAFPLTADESDARTFMGHTPLNENPK